MTAVLLQRPRDAEGSKFAPHYPMWGNGAPIVYWAQGGRIHCRDERPETPNDRRFNSIHWREMAQRVLMFSQMIVDYKADGPEEARRWKFERQRAQKWVCEMEDVIREAREQTKIKDDQEYVVNRAIAKKARAQSGDKEMEKQGLAGKTSVRVVLPKGSCDF
jgi:hypothetical protein